MNSRVHPKYKTKYRVTNWAEYDQALVERGDITLWISPCGSHPGRFRLGLQSRPDAKELRRSRRTWPSKRRSLYGKCSGCRFAKPRASYDPCLI